MPQNNQPFGPASNVRWAVDLLELDAVQHGVTAVDIFP